MIAQNLPCRLGANIASLILSCQISSQSVIAGGCIINGGTVVDSVLGRGVFVHTGSRVKDSVILDGCRILRRARVQRAIIDKNVVVPEREDVGWNIEKDRQRFTVTATGLTVVPKGYKF